MLNLYLVWLLIALQTGFSEELDAVICQRRSSELECKNDEVLFIDLAWYGRTDDRCGAGNSTNCINSSGIHLIKNNCECKIRCRIQASNEIFGNPCPGEGKFLYTSYRCINSEACIEKSRNTAVVAASSIPVTTIVPSAIGNAANTPQQLTTAIVKETTKRFYTEMQNNQLEIQSTILHTTSFRVTWKLITSYTEKVVYMVYVRTVDQPCGSYLGDNTKSPYRATGLDPGTAYKVRVCVYEKDNLQPLHTEMINVITKPPSLSQVTNVFSKKGLQLNWKPIKGYADQIVIELTRSNVVKSIQLAPFATNYTLINIEEGDTYHIKLYSTITDVNGEQLRSDVVVLSSHNPPNVIGIALGSVFGGLVLVAVIAGVLIYWRKYKNAQKTKIKKSRVFQSAIENESFQFEDGQYITVDQGEHHPYEEVKAQAPSESGYVNVQEKSKDQHTYELYTPMSGAPKCKPRLLQ